MQIGLKELEAIIFLSEKAISFDELMDFFKVDLEYLKVKLNELKEKKQNDGINLLIKNNTVRFITNAECGEVVSNFFNPTTRVKKLSKTTMETLTIIAIKGAITKSEIENIKGVSVDGSIQVLLEKGLICSNSRKKALGNPKLYEVTDKFYGYIGLESKDELLEMQKSIAIRDFKGENDENK